MDKETKRRVKITIMGLIGLVILILGISYAAFSADLAGLQVQSINTGCLKVEMSDDGDLSIKDAMPVTDENGLSSTPYKFTITNSCTVDAYYTTTINVLDESNIDNTEKVKVSLSGNSYVAPIMESSLTELTDDEKTKINEANEGQSFLKSYKLDEGYLKVGDSKEFELRTWIDYNVTNISGALNNKIVIDSYAADERAIMYDTNSAGYDVLNGKEKLENVNYKNIAPGNTEKNGIVEEKVDEGVVYYFRGNTDNHIKFGTPSEDMKLKDETYEEGELLNWEVVSTNSDGSINIILDKEIGEGTFNNSTTVLDEFYSENLSTEESYIDVKHSFCEEGASTEGNYLGKIRVENYNPESECESTNKLSKIGLPTVDEVMYAGGVNNKENQNLYIKGTEEVMTGTSVDENNIYVVDVDGKIKAESKDVSIGIKPMITLKSDTKIEGEGTEDEPFYVSGKYEEKIESKDKIAPVIDIATVDDKWTNEDKSIMISARDNSSGSGIAGYYVSNNEEATLTGTEEGWEASTSNNHLTTKKYDNGTYYVYVKDGAGNISKGKKVVIERVDKIAPTCTLRINPNGTKTNYKTLTIETDDKYIDFEGYTWDDMNNKNDVAKVTENGTYKAHLTDLAGNQGTCEATVITIEEENLDGSGANEPVLSSNMIPVYYDEGSEVWRKAEKINTNSEYKWYDYEEKMWANSVTVKDTSESTALKLANGETKECTSGGGGM